MAKRTLGNIEHGQVLRVVVEHEQTAHEVENNVIHEGHKVLEAKRINKTDWEMLIQKQNNLYTI